jgi:hypothetical protein
VAAFPRFFEVWATPTAISRFADIGDGSGEDALICTAGTFAPFLSLSPAVLKRGVKQDVEGEMLQL